MADDLEEELSLDVGPALAQVDRLEARIAEIATRSSAALSKALADGLDKATAKLPAAKGLDVPVRADTADIDAAQAKIADFLAGTRSAEVGVDVTTQGATEAANQLVDLEQQAQRTDARDVDVAVTATGVDATLAQLREVDRSASRIGDLAKRAAAGFGVGALLRSGYDRFTTIQDATAALTISLGDAEQAAKVIEDVTRTVQGTPFNLDQFAAAAQQMIGVGVEAQKIPGYLEAIGEASATQGKRANEFADRLSTVFSQVSASGQLQLIDVWRISDTGVAALQILGNEFGVTTQEMKDMISEGAVPAERALDALARGIVHGSDGVNGATRALGGTMESLREQLSGAVGGVGAAVARFGESVLEPLSEGLTQTAADVSTGLDRAGRIAGRASDVIGRLLGNDMVRGATLTGAAALATIRTLQVLMSVSQRAAGGLGSVAEAVGLRSVGERLNRFAAGSAATEAAAALKRYETAVSAARQTSSELATAVAQVSRETALGAQVHDTYGRMVAAQAARQKAAMELVRAEAGVRKAREAVLAGEAGAVARLDSALAAQSAAQQRVAVTANEAAAAEARFASATNAASVANVQGAGAANSLAVANTNAQRSATQASGALSGIGGAASAITAPLIAVAAVLGTVAVAVNKWQERNDEARRVAGTAADTFDSFAESLGLTNAEIASLDADTAVRNFEQATRRVEAFKESLSAQGVDTSLFTKAAVDNGVLQDALNGSEEAINRVKAAMVDRSDLSFTGDPFSLGRFINRAFDDSGKIDAWIEGERKREAAAVRSAKAIARTNDVEKLAADTAAQTTVRNVLASRAVEQLTQTEQTRLRALLLGVDAMAREEEQTQATAAALQTLTGRNRELYEAALAGDLGAARAFAATDAYEDLDAAAQKPIDSLIAQGDAAAEAAAGLGLLVSAAGDVVASMAGLNSELDRATSRYLALSGAQASLAASGRNVRATIDSVGEAIRTHGAQLDDTTASVDAAAITVDNYKAVLATLPRSVRLRIESIGVDRATKEAEDFAEAVDRAADAVASAEDKLLDIRREQAEAAYRAQERAKKIARGDTEDLGPAEFGVPDFSARIARAERDLERARRKEQEVRAGRTAGSREAARSAAEEEAAEERRAAAVREAVRNGEITAATGKLIRDNSREVADAVDAAAQAIRQNGIDLLNTTQDVDHVQRVMSENAAKLGEEARQAFIDVGLSAEEADAKVAELLDTQRLLPDQIKVDFEASGIDRIVDSINRLSLMLAAMSGLIDPGTLNRLLAIDGDPAEQVRLLNEEIAKLDPDQQVIVRAILDLDDTTAVEARAKAEALASGDPVRIAIALGVDETEAATAMDEIQQIATDRNMEIQVDADTLQAVIEIDRAAAKRIAEIEARGGGTDEVNRVLDEAARDRTAVITARVRFEPESGGDQRLLSLAESYAARGRDSGGSAITPSTTVSPASAATASNWTTRRNQAVDMAYARGDNAAAAAIWKMTKEEFEAFERLISGGKVQHRATGGWSGIDDDELLKALGSDKKARAGLNAPGSYRTVTSEDGTGGEWVLSRDPAVRNENRRLAEVALADLGGPRIDPAAARIAAPPLVQVSSQASPEMIGELRNTAAAVTEAVGRLDRIAAAAKNGGITNIQINESLSPRQTADEIQRRKKAEGWRAQATGRI